ncbi:aquaporin-like protein [Paraphaeosphaeria sporulosa]|uniref:Aquaporin-like protein n=1 Tax=Paraphaeosphaeria sporulosa TaxID=1460663 RepID=A0A177CKL0_9PLEO|nr:aquaporin-like protein [Paraphaeosphaeria sporulosa]OAG07380.1 aquaporin-like protein [Paraphaeosphaeria sporulosa]
MAITLLPLHKKDGGPPRRANGHIPNTRNKPRGTSKAQQKASALGISSRWRNELVAAAAEFAGTFMFLFFAFGGTQVANSAASASNSSTAGGQDNSITQTPDTSILLYISLIFGFSLMVNVWVFFRVSGGLFNPAVTLGLYMVGALTGTRAVLCFISQMAAGMCAAGVVSAILPGPLNVSTTLGSGTTIAQGVFLEMFLTALLVFTIFMLAAEKHKATFLAPIGIGLALFVAELVGVFYTGGSLNPTRSFGPCVVTHNFPGYHYIYWFGPLMGTLLAYGMYKIVKSVEYETVNPGQDFDDHEAALFNPPDDPESKEQVERPNPAAIAAQEAVRVASHSSGSRSQDFDGIEGRMSPEYHPGYEHSHQQSRSHERPAETHSGQNGYTGHMV